MRRGRTVRDWTKSKNPDLRERGTIACKADRDPVFKVRQPENLLSNHDMFDVLAANVVGFGPTTP